MNTHRFAAIAAILALVAAPAGADWMPGDDHKMHYPQLPDPDGWDVDVLTDTIYDDFKCTRTAPIEDVHFWVSWRGDDIGQIAWIDLSLHKDVPANADQPSHPDSVMYDNDNRLWFQRFSPGQFSAIPYGNGDQGWLQPNPEDPVWNRPDHQQFFQINISQIDEPFIQREGTIYWLGVHIGVESTNTAIGWKTSQNHWNDDAAYWYGGSWRELVDPLDGVSLDMAFVITGVPEPAAVFLVAVGLVAASTRRRV